VLCFSCFRRPRAIGLRHSRNVLLASVTQVGVLVLYLLVLLLNLDNGYGDFVNILWLAIPVSFAICLSARPVRSPTDVDKRPPDARRTTHEEPA
jgi:hypothetical protein